MVLVLVQLINVSPPDLPLAIFTGSLSHTLSSVDTREMFWVWTGGLDAIASVIPV